MEHTFEWARSIGLVVPKPEETDDDEEIDDLSWVALHIEDEGVGHRGWRPDNHDDLRGASGSTERWVIKRRTEGIRWMISPGRGDFPVGQFEAQNLLPNGRGIPSFASSWFIRAAAKD